MNITSECNISQIHCLEMDVLTQIRKKMFNPGAHTLVCILSSTLQINNFLSGNIIKHCENVIHQFSNQRYYK